MQTTLTFETKKQNLLRTIMAVDAESIIDMMTKYYDRITSKKEADDTLMSEEEFYARIDHSIAQCERGECVTMPVGQSVEAFINSL